MLAQPQRINYRYGPANERSEGRSRPSRVSPLESYARQLFDISKWNLSGLGLRIESARRIEDSRVGLVK
jgi:hypothetical protein